MVTFTWIVGQRSSSDRLAAVRFCTAGIRPADDARCVPVCREDEVVIEPPPETASAERIIAALAELIEALDRRVPHVERAGEARIASEAQGLREQAVARIEELKRRPFGPA